jgi:magnesium transporter
MAESLRNTSKKTGLPPGSLIHVGDILEPATRMSVINYSTESIEGV